MAWIWSSTAWSGWGAYSAPGERRVCAIASATFGPVTGAVWQPAITVGCMPVLLAADHLANTTSYMLLAYASLALVTVRIGRTGETRWWLAGGAIIGVGADDSHLVAIFAVVLLVSALALPGARRLVLDRWALLGAVIALVLFLPDVWWLPYAALSLPFLLLFRLTCYYYRGAYYRTVWQSPSACAVAEPRAHYTGETKFPLIIQNTHRYFFYIAGIISVINTYDAIVAFHSDSGPGGFGFGLGNLILLGNVISAFALDYYAVVLGYAVVSLGLGFARPGFMAGSSLALGPREQGAIAGVMVALMGLCFLFPPIVGVALYELSGPTPFILNAAMAAACVAMALMWRPLARAGETVDHEQTPTAPTP